MAGHPHRLSFFSLSPSRESSCSPAEVLSMPMMYSKTRSARCLARSSIERGYVGFRRFQFCFSLSLPASTGVLSSSLPVAVQFCFEIEKVETGERTKYSGICTSNGVRTPPYTLLLRYMESGEEQETKRVTQGERFQATTETELEQKYEALVHFRIFPVFNTETYIYQEGNKLIWYIGYDIVPTTEIIYHIYTW